MRDSRLSRRTYSPEALEDVQMDIVLGELVVDGEVALGLGEEGGIGHGGGCGAPSMVVEGGGGGRGSEGEGGRDS